MGRKPFLLTGKQVTFLALALLLTLNGLKAQSITENLRKADSLAHHEQEAAALGIYDQILQKDPSQKTALARSSILILRKGKRQTDSKNANALYNQARTLAENAVEKDPNYAPATYAMALSLYTIALRQGVKEKIKGLKEVKDYLDRTFLLDSAYAPAWYLMGRWNMAFNKMNFAERAAVKLFFGGMPEANVSMAITDFLKCKKLAPSFIRNYYHLGLAYHTHGEDLKAISVLQEAVHLRPLLQDDRDLQKKCQELIKRLR